MGLLVEAREGVRRQEAWGLTCALAQGQLSASQVALGEAVAAITMPRHPLYSQ